MGDSSERPNTWRYPMFGHNRCAWELVFSIFIHFARLLQWIFTDSSDLNASELFPMLWRQAIVPQAFPTYLGIGGSSKRDQTDSSMSVVDKFELCSTSSVRRYLQRNLGYFRILLDVQCQCSWISWINMNRCTRMILFLDSSIIHRCFKSSGIGKHHRNNKLFRIRHCLR